MKEDALIESRIETAKALFGVLSREITLEEAKGERVKRDEESEPDL